MNIYRYSFISKCPSDGTEVQYNLEITSPGKILAEDIRAICDAGPSHHEELANKLAPLGGRQVMKARHMGVEIETIRP